MEEFNFAEGGTGRGRNIGRIVGFREHVFTHDVSAVANFFSLQELNFVSATQRVLDNPLHVRTRPSEWSVELTGYAPDVKFTYMRKVFLFVVFCVPSKLLLAVMALFACFNTAWPTGKLDFWQ